MGFGHYLQEKRKQLALTQPQLAERLQHFSLEFEAVDAVTISRWERSKTTPSTYKQGLIIHFMGDSLIQHNHVFEIHSAPHSLFDLKDGLQNRYLSGSPYADSPYIDPSSQILLHKAKSQDIPQAYIDDIASFDSRLYENPFSLDLNTIYQRARTAPSIEFYAYSIKQQLQGHVVFMFFPVSQLQRFSQDSKTQIPLEALVNLNEQDCIAYIGSMYGGAKAIGKHMYACLLYFLELYSHIRYFILEIHNQAMLQFCQALGFEVIYHGQEADNAAIKIEGKSYRSVRTCISVEKFLSHPQVIELIRFKLHHFATFEQFSVDT